MQNFVTSSKTYRTQKEYWHGIDVTTSARLPRRITVAGGPTSGTEGYNTDACFVGVMRFCKVDFPTSGRG